MAERVASNIANMPWRKLAPLFDSAGHYTSVTGNQANAIGIDPPSTFFTTNGGPGQADCTANINIAMGVAGEDNTVGIAVDTACTITLYTWCKALNKWIFGGAGTAVYQKAFAANSWDNFVLAQGTLFYLSASVLVVNAAIGGNNLRGSLPYDANPINV